MKLHTSAISYNISDKLRVISELPAGVGCRHFSSTSPNSNWQPIGKIIRLLIAEIVSGGSNADY
jgi:hypothetical protein